MNLAAYIDGAVRANPDDPAVIWPEGTLSYGALGERSARLAGGLTARFGLKPGDRVAIFMENSEAFYPILLACWRAGLSAVPINAKLHARELHWIVEDSGAKVLCASEAGAAAVTSLDDATWPPVVVAPGADFTRLYQSDPLSQHDGRTLDEAWLFYTSGTTGRPKGAMLSHRSLLFMCHAYYADVDFIDRSDTTLHAAPLTHGSGLYGLAAMLKGGRNVVLPGFEPGAVFDAIATHPNVSMFAAPTMVTRLINDLSAGTRDLTNLKTITYGGAPMYVSDLEKSLALFGPRLYGLYGQGESPMTITGLPKALHVRKPEESEEAQRTRLASAGIARTGVAVRVVDDGGRDMPPGETGEIITKSDALMLGYWNNEPATADTIRDGWLWTGDVGAIDRRGFITLKDRSKDMIISGGTNIYPREIEEVLLRHPDVRECAVTGRPHADWGEEVVAFVVAEPGCSIDEAALDQLCLDNIARFKRPKAYRVLDALPKNNYGKILKTELRKLEGR